MAEVEVSEATLRDLPLPPIDGEADKRGRGTVLVVGGTVETPGAVMLAGVAALRVGAGRLRIATAREVAPHVGIAVPEARVLGLPAPLDEHEAAALGDTGDAVVSCRGATTRTTAPGAPAYVDRAGSAGLATSGSGDVAAGVVAGLAARGAPPLTAAVWGARLHRRAGERLGASGFLARELLTTLREDRG